MHIAHLPEHLCFREAALPFAHRRHGDVVYRNMRGSVPDIPELLIIPGLRWRLTRSHPVIGAFEFAILCGHSKLY